MPRRDRQSPGYLSRRKGGSVLQPVGFLAGQEHAQGRAQGSCWHGQRRAGMDGNRGSGQAVESKLLGVSM